MKLEIKTRKHFGGRMARFRTEVQFEARVTRYSTDTNEETAAFRQAVAAIKDALQEEGQRIFFRPEKVLEIVEDKAYHTPEAIAQFAKQQQEIDLLKADKPIEGESLNAILANPPLAPYKPPTEAQFRAIKARLEVAEKQAREWKKGYEALKAKIYHGEINGGIK